MSQQTLTTDFARAREHYTQPRRDDELDLIARIESAMTSMGFDPVRIEVFVSDPSIIVARQRNSAVQRYVLNRFWTTQLYIVPDNTEELRMLLFPEGDIENWVDAVEKRILPFAQTKGLPVSVN